MKTTIGWPYQGDIRPYNGDIKREVDYGYIRGDGGSAGLDAGSVI